MRFFLAAILALSLLTTSCNQNNVQSALDCRGSIHFSDTKEMKDVMKKFQLNVPKTWKSNLYFDEYQSALYTADTTKELSETYIVDLAWHQGELLLDDNLDTKIKDLVQSKEQLETLKSGFSNFKNTPSYYNLSIGSAMQKTYHYLQIFTPTKVDEYYTFTVKIYGEEAVEERICESIALFENLTFLD